MKCNLRTFRKIFLSFFKSRNFTVESFLKGKSVLQAQNSHYWFFIFPKSECWLFIRLFFIGPNCVYVPSGLKFREISCSAHCTAVAKLQKFNVAGGADHENFSKITFYSAFLQASLQPWTLLYDMLHWIQIQYENELCCSESEHHTPK